MKKKTFALCGLVAVAGLSLASCNNNDDGKIDEPVYETEGGELDIHINYQAESGVTYRDANAYVNVIDGKTYTQGSLLPTWNAFAANTRTTIYEASAYTTNDAAKNWETVKTKNYESEVTTGRKIDLFMTTTANIKSMGASGEAVNLLDHLDEMPNFSAWLDANPTIKGQITTDGKIYYTPYFDGYNDIERMFVMNTTLTKAVLDATSFADFDTTQNGGANPAANVVQKGAYTPFINADYNYASDTKLKVLNGETVEEITVKKTTNIIKQQNALLEAGCTGKELAEQFRSYLDAAYAGLIGEGKLYKNYSDIFISSAAAYNVDEMIALFRVVKANPGVITGDSTKEVEIFTPRGVANNRVDNMADIMQIWGVNGMVSEKEMLYYTPDGKLADAATTQGTYDALKYLSDIYDEGLILGNFYYKQSGGTGTTYLDTYFGRTKGDEYGLMLYDYSASTGSVNDKVDGIGTDTSKRVSANTSVQGVMPILPPYTYWATESTWKVSQSLSDFTGKTLTRFAGENRTLKDGSWCIPTNSDNVSGACRLMDYLFSDMGSKIQDFGPEEYWGEVSTTLVPGENTPIFSAAFKAMIGNSGTEFWTFMRKYIGSTHGIGCVRSKGLDIQATNAYAQVGLTNLKQAIAKGVVNSSLLDKYSDGSLSWDSSVPSAGYPSINTDVANTYGALTAFWSSNKCAETAQGWVAYVIAEGGAANDAVLGKDSLTNDYSLNTVLSQLETKNTSYLAVYQAALNK